MEHDSNLRLSAFRNSDGSVIVVGLNAASSANQVSFSLQNTAISAGTATPYLTNGSNSTAGQSAIPVSGGAFTATVPARSLVTYVVRGGGSAFRLRNAASGTCLDVPNGTSADGTHLQLWTCHTGANQMVTQVGNTLQMMGKCLDAYNWGTTNGTRVVLWTCHGGANQQWTMRSDGSIAGVHSGRCLSTANAGTANGSRMALYDCNGQPYQRWTRA